MPWAAAAGAISGIASAAGSIIGGNEINDAAQSAVNWNKKVYTDEQSSLSPWASTGANALYSLSSLLGVPTTFGPQTSTSVPAPAGGTAAGMAGAGAAPGTPGAAPTIQQYMAQGGSFGGKSGSSLFPNWAASGTPTAQATPAPGPTAQPAGTASNYGSPTSAFQAFTQTPYYQFPFQQGQQALHAQMAQRGLGNSGASAKDLLQYATGYASSGLGSYLSALSGLATSGQGAIESAASTGVGVAGNVLSGQLTGAGAQAAGLGGAIQNLVGPQGGFTPLLNGSSPAFNSSSYGGGGSPSALQQAWGLGGGQYVP